MGTRQVLVVEDTVELRMVLEQQLTDAGYGVRAVGSGEEALTEVSRSVPDVVLLDLNLPGMNGWDFLRRLREDVTTAAIPVVILSSEDDTAALIRGYGHGACYYVTKPHDKDELLRGLELFKS